MTTPFRPITPQNPRVSFIQFTLQPSAPGAATLGSNSCEIRLRETGMSVGATYNEVEEDAEGNGRTAAAASVGVSRVLSAAD